MMSERYRITFGLPPVYRPPRERRKVADLTLTRTTAFLQFAPLSVLFYWPAADSAIAAASVFCNSIAIVIGPTPPGTGVMAEATCAAGP